MNRRIALVLVSLATSWSPAVGQQLWLPSAQAATEGNSQGSIAGFDARWRQQILIGSTALRPLAGKTITALMLRRDSGLGQPFDAGAASLRVSVSETTTSLHAPSAVFARNRGPVVSTVLQGTISLPASPAPPAAIPWTAPYIAKLDFSGAGYPYMGGNLCVEIEGEPLLPSDGSAWWADYVDSATGTAIPVGSPCGSPAGEAEYTAGAGGPRTLAPGSSLMLYSFGRPGTPGILMFGTPLATPLPLDGLGAPGCTLMLQPAAQLTGVYGAPGRRWQHGVLKIVLDSPSSPALSGQPFRTQWANLEMGSAASNTARVTTTNAVDITLSTLPGTLDMSTVDSTVVDRGSPFPDRGRVTVARGPALRIDFR